MEFIERLRNRNRKSFDNFILVIGIFEPIITLPQVYQVWVNHQTAGVSFITWAFYTLASVAWGVYGIVIKDKPVIITSILWSITEAAVAIGVLVR